jgi:gamma-glutamyltranspeptidase/glutathione hydrolase
MLNNRLATPLAFLVFALSVGCSPQEPQPTAAPTVAEQEPELQSAAVAMPDLYGAAVAEQILKAGGNAVDAGIAAGFTLAVTYPEAGNIGGGGFMLIRMNGEDAFIDYREMAPAAADRDMYLDVNGNVIQGPRWNSRRQASRCLKNLAAACSRDWSATREKPTLATILAT